MWGLPTFVLATSSRTHTLKARGKTDTGHTSHHAHCPSNWLTRFWEEFMEHLIGYNQKQSPLTTIGLAVRLVGSRVSNVWGDYPGVDKNGLSVLEHLGQSLFVFFLTNRLGLGRTTPTRIYALALVKQTPLPKPGTWSYRLTSRPVHSRKRKVGLYCSKLAS